MRKAGKNRTQNRVKTAPKTPPNTDPKPGKNRGYAEPPIPPSASALPEGRASHSLASNFQKPPMAETGSSFWHRSQQYSFEGTQSHVTRTGRRTKLHVLKTTCPDCGAPFQLLASSTSIRNRVLRRRCDDCKRRGVPVEPHWRSSRERVASPPTPVAETPPSALLRAVLVGAARRQRQRDALTMLA